MKAQQLLTVIIKPTLEYMAGNYDSLNARMILLATSAIESNCGYYIVQVNGPALGPWQMEPATNYDIVENCDALRNDDFLHSIKGLSISHYTNMNEYNLKVSPMYACAMARLKYAMDPNPLPDHNDKRAIYNYYKRIYNTELGASTWDKFCIAWNANGLDRVRLT